MARAQNLELVIHAAAQPSHDWSAFDPRMDFEINASGTMNLLEAKPYKVFGYGGRQVRDNLHSVDMVAAFAAFHDAPRKAAVYNFGGGRESNCSMLEAITSASESRDGS